MAAQQPVERDHPESPAFVVVGYVLGTRGLRGEIKVTALTSFPQRLEASQVVYLTQTPYTIENSRRMKGHYILKLAKVDNLEAAATLNGKYLEVPAETVETLPDGHYYHFQILGLEVWTTKGDRLGEVVRIEETGSNDVYVVSTSRGEVLIPAIEDVIKAVELQTGRLVIDPIEGLLG
jgi:16S rRNA processing protein RimM